MTEPKLISPLLDNFDMGEPISNHNGVRCCPAMEKGTDDKYIVKIISIPASQVQLDALLLSGAYENEDAAQLYFKELSDNVVEEAQILKRLSQLEGYLPFTDWQVVEHEDRAGFDIYLLSPYKRTLESHFKRTPMTHLGAINLGLDICAALTASRRSGYLYVDLKPGNIYLADDVEFRIGDLGFMNLDSLKYASLPDKYRSAYTAPEIADAFSTLNTTIDIYAAGLILYQAYNGGVLPFNDECVPGDVLPPPAYADAEIAEIILKACSSSPDERWQDPTEMGQELVNYMQRNGANDTPIIPPVEINEEPEEYPVEAEVSSEEVTDATAQSDADEEVASEEDELVNLSFLDDESETNAALENEEAEIDYDAVAEDASEILNQADDLLAHPTPDPVIPPEPVDIPIPPPLPLEPEEDEVSEDEPAEEETDSDSEPAEEAVEEISEDAVSEDDDNAEEIIPVAAEHKSRRWILRTIIAILSAAILVAGFFFYKNYYVQTIDSLSLTGDRGTLTVELSTKTDESLLTVVCSDTYGNLLEQPVKNGKAVFTGLAPNSAFTINVLIDGFHHLNGETSAAYSTPAQTSIVQFNAVAGAEDGSVILSFTIDGKDPEQWSIIYSADGVAEQTISFTGKMTTLSDLQMGSEYTFRLVSNESLYIIGTEEIKFTPCQIVRAENVAVTSCINNKLTVVWNSPEGASVNSWTVRCYNENGFDETLKVTDCTAVFDGLDHTAAYTVEVTAANMSVNERVYVKENSLTITSFTIDSTNPNKFVLSWESASGIPEGGWLVSYSVDGYETKEIAVLDANTAEITTVIPGASYTFSILAANGTGVLGAKQSLVTPEAGMFTGFDITAEDMEFKMCRTPNVKNWDRYDLKNSDYTTNFKVGEKASFLVRLHKLYSVTSDEIVTVYVVRDETGKVVSAASEASTWKDMWYWYYCELDVPSIPSNPGNYTINIYFNGALAGQQAFTVVAE